MAKALVNWIKPEDGGKRKKLEIDFIFYPMIKIDGDNDLIHWSFYIINKEFISEYQTISEIDFLLEKAPHYLLKPGIKFKLYEGGIKEIASGEIINN